MGSNPTRKNIYLFDFPYSHRGDSCVIRHLILIGGINLSTTANVSSEFEYFNIMDVDPSAKPIEKGVYKLRLTKVESTVIVPAKGKNAGQETTVVKGAFTVIDDDRYSGRKLWNDFWLSNTFAQKQLRKLADATGITQDAGEALAGWLGRLTEFQPEFKVFVEVESYTDREGKVGEKNVINFFQASPV